MTGGLFPVLLLMLGAWIWLAGARAREFAIVLARRHCDNRALQLLDETVALSRVGIRWTNAGIRVRRMYRFEFSLEGAGRRVGYVLMLGMDLEAIDDGLDDVGTEGGDDGSDGVSARDSDKVIPFRRRDK